ncbi:hypothetical protein VTG60DRAFT_439 [Thermothelomyces hinnuleus]
MTLSFSKGISAPIGAAVVGSAAVIRRVKRLRQSIGPGDVDARGVLGKAHTMAAAVARMWTDRDGSLSRPTETNKVWLDLAGAGVTVEMLNDLGMRNGILLAGPQIVLHHQIGDKALASLERVFDDLLARRQPKAAVKPSEAAVRSKACVQARW